MTKLIRCRCGSEASIDMGEGVESHIVGCNSENCGQIVSVPYFSSEQELIDKWNTKQSLPEDKNEFGHYLYNYKSVLQRQTCPWR